MIIFSIKNLLLSRGYGQHFLISEIFVLLTVKTKCWGKHLQTFDIKFIFILININLYFSRKTFFHKMIIIRCWEFNCFGRNILLSQWP